MFVTPLDERKRNFNTRGSPICGGFQFVIVMFCFFVLPTSKHRTDHFNKYIQEDNDEIIITRDRRQLKGWRHV